MEIKINNESELEDAARVFLKELGGKRHVAFNAEMGGGKTTFISALCRVMGVDDEVNSPTFSIINEYALPGGENIYHFDFYRIESDSEAAALGLEEYFDTDALCLMEWPSNVERFLPEDTLFVSIFVAPDESRIIKF